MSNPIRDERVKEGMSPAEIEKIGGHVDLDGTARNPGGGVAWSSRGPLTIQGGTAQPPSGS